MSFRLGSLIYLDPERDVVRDKQRNVKVTDRATTRDLFSLASIVDSCERVDGLTLVTPNGEHDLPARGYALTLKLEHMNTPVAALYHKVTGRPRALSSNENSSTNVSFERAHVNVSFHRTPRIPDDDEEYPNLPATVGQELRVVEGSDGTLALPLAQSEALSLRLRTRETVAIKVGFDNKNAVTGERWIPGHISQTPQNYIVCPQQLWLRGAHTREGGGAAQFLARELEALTERPLREQFKGRVRPKLLTLEVFPMNSALIWIPRLRKFVDSSDKTSRQLGLEPGHSLCFFPTRSTHAPELCLSDYGVKAKDEIIVRYSKKTTVVVKYLNGKRAQFEVSRHDSVYDLKCRFEALEDIPVEVQRLVFGGQQLPDSALLCDCGIYEFCEMHVVLRAGGGLFGASAPLTGKSGKLFENICKDEGSLDRFCISLMESTTVQVVNSLQFARMSGREMTPSPFNRELFFECGIPWTAVCDRDAAMRVTLAKALAARPTAVLESGIPECSSCRERKSCTELLACKHIVCDECMKRHSGTLELLSDSGDDSATSEVLKCPTCSANGYKKKVCFGAQIERGGSVPSLASDGSSTASTTESSRPSENNVKATEQSWSFRMKRRRHRLSLI